MKTESNGQAPTRRQFLKSSSAAAAGAAVSSLAIQRASYAASGDTIRIGLIGCGGRGTGAAKQALRADKNIKLVAMADAFSDKITLTHKSLSAIGDIKEKIEVPADKRFVGFDAYKKVTDAVDVVLLTTPPQFRPMHIKYAIDTGRHVFAEKPVAVDAPGVRSVLETCQKAKTKGLSVVSGLCLRYYNCFEETIKRIHDGAIGDVMTLQANDYRGAIWNRTREDLKKLLGREPTEMEYQMRNWYHFTWLSGDFNVEQHVHFLDVCAWAKGGYPEDVVCMGGRMTRPDTGNIYDHFSAVYTYADGARFFSNSRQVPGRGLHKNMSASVIGTKGSGVISERKLSHHLKTKDGEWRFHGKHNDFYQTEHDRLFDSIRKGKPINNGEYMSRSTMLAIMARMSAYTGARITWKQAMESKLDLSPPAYTWDAPIKARPVSVPGVTKFM